MTRDFPAIQRVLIVTFLLNMLATIPKLVVGIATGALSLVADGLDSLFDGVSNVIGLAAVRVSSRPPDDEHPYGHRKFETVAALFIAAALFITAWELALAPSTGCLTRPRRSSTGAVSARSSSAPRCKAQPAGGSCARRGGSTAKSCTPTPATPSPASA